MVSLLASERQYLDHLVPVFFALPPEARDGVWVTGALANDPETLASSGVAEYRVGVPEGLTLVASYRDCRSVRGPTAYLEHGAGQRYLLEDGSRDPSYAGSGDHDNAVIFLTPREEVAGWWREVYPSVPAVAVGCPKLDRVATTRRPGGKVVAVSFHHDARLVKETTSVFPHFDPYLPGFVAAMRAEGFEVLGHGHPRLWGRVEPRWRELGVEPVADLSEVMARAGVYACDNSSSLPECAAAGIPLVWMEAPWWRREVEHGGRFWDWSRGQVECRDPATLAECVLAAFEDPPGVRAAREAMLADVYMALDGRAAERAAAAILDVLTYLLPSGSFQQSAVAAAGKDAVDGGGRHS